MTIQQAQQQLLFQLYHLYDNREAANIADWVMEHLTGWKKIDRIVNKQVPLLPEKVQLLTRYTEQLLQHKPVQYVLQEAWFCGMPLYVNEQVLIPRPETEELVNWILEEWKTAAAPTSPIITDIGTGSGCIPVALKKNLPNATVYACDISPAALEVAATNATKQQTPLHLLETNVLTDEGRAALPASHIFVSNPPYIPLRDEATMQPNVLQHEPHLALFVQDDDPLLFYRAIAELASPKLLPGGKVYAEIHEDLGAATRQCFLDHGFAEVIIKKDMQGKERMIRASK